MPKDLHQKALRLGATDFGYSKAKGKRFYVVYQGRKINFGSKTGQTFYDHGDADKRNAWMARHSKLSQKKGARGSGFYISTMNQFSQIRGLCTTNYSVIHKHFFFDGA